MIFHVLICVSGCVESSCRLQRVTLSLTLLLKPEHSDHHRSSLSRAAQIFNRSHEVSGRGDFVWIWLARVNYAESPLNVSVRLYERPAVIIKQRVDEPATLRIYLLLCRQHTAKENFSNLLSSFIPLLSSQTPWITFCILLASCSFFISLFLLYVHLNIPHPSPNPSNCPTSFPHFFLFSWMNPSVLFLIDLFPLLSTSQILTCRLPISSCILPPLLL